MSFIYVHTDNSNVADKLYTALKAGAAAAKAEAKMQKAITKVVGKATGFTTTKTDDAKGYVIRLSVAKVEIVVNKTKCSLSGSIGYYPPKVTKKGDTGEEMLSTSMTGNATADGTNEAALLDCVEAIAEDLAAKAIPIMRTDAAARSGGTP